MLFIGDIWLAIHLTEDLDKTGATCQSARSQKIKNDAHQADLKRGESPIAKATANLLYRALHSSHSHSEAARSQVTFNLAAGTLAAQKERLRTDGPTKDYITNLLLDAHQSFKQLQDHPNIKEELCDYLIRPGLQEKERFATRELLEMYCNKGGKRFTCEGINASCRGARYSQKAP